MASASTRATGLRLPSRRLRGISRVGNIPAVRMAAINSRSAISDLPMLHESFNTDRTRLSRAGLASKW